MVEILMRDDSDVTLGSMFTLYPNNFLVSTRKSCPRYITNLYTYPICDSSLSLEIGATQIRSVTTEIARKSPFLCVNRNSIRHRFRADAKPICYR